MYHKAIALWNTSTINSSHGKHSWHFLVSDIARIHYLQWWRGIFVIHTRSCAALNKLAKPQNIIMSSCLPGQNYFSCLCINFSATVVSSQFGSSHDQLQREL